MAFSWTDINGAIISASHHNEIKTNADSLASSLSVPNYTWTHTITPGNIILDDYILELRDAVDYLDDNNYCRSHNNNANSAYLNGERTDHDGTDNTTDNGTDNGTDNAVNLAGDNDAHDLGDNSIAYTSALNTQNSTYKYNDDTLHNQGEYETVYNDVNSSINGINYSFWDNTN